MTLQYDRNYEDRRQAEAKRVASIRKEIENIERRLADGSERIKKNHMIKNLNPNGEEIILLLSLRTRRNLLVQLKQLKESIK